MATKTVKLENFASELKKEISIRDEEYRAAVTSGVIGSLPKLIRESPVDTGEYAQSWDFTETEQSVILGNYAPHAPIIERGARPFTPPIGPLLAWAKRVLKDPSQPPNYSSQVWALAKGTQAKIEKNGMEPRHILEKNLPGIIENIKQEMSKIG